jgi:(5-formylfuran-3-yl)methyl phosphate synthase
MNRRFTGMLASVTSVAEAKLALDGGADIIDLKDPAAGALGALPLNVVRNVTTLVAGRTPVSATVGDLLNPSRDELLNAVEGLVDAGIDYVKVGFFAGQDVAAHLAAMSDCAKRGTPIIAVLFADVGWPSGMVARLMAHGVTGVMIDTAEKNGRSLLRHITEQELAFFLRDAESRSLVTGLAGSLTEVDVGRLLPLKPGYLGFRGALCDGLNRLLGLDVRAIARIRRAMNGEPVTQFAASGG